MSFKVDLPLTPRDRREAWGTEDIPRDVVARMEVQYSLQNAYNCGFQFITNLTTRISPHYYSPTELPQRLWHLTSPWDRRIIQIKVPPRLCAKLREIGYLRAAERIPEEGNVAAYLLTDNVARTGLSTKDMKTSEFVRFLIKKRIGVVYATPVALNPVHKSQDDYSLIQTWYWIPPVRLKYNTYYGGRSWGRKKLKGLEEFLALNKAPPAVRTKMGV